MKNKKEIEKIVILSSGRTDLKIGELEASLVNERGVLIILAKINEIVDAVNKLTNK